jgi:hypothetical protein
MPRLIEVLIVAGTLVSAPVGARTKWRTPWGDPDLQGSWSNATTTPLERPAKYAGREFLTPQNRAEQDKETAIGRDARCTGLGRRRQRRVQRGLVGARMVGRSNIPHLRSTGRPQAAVNTGGAKEKRRAK